MEEDKDLLLLLNKGDRKAFEQLVHMHSNMVYSICFNLIQNKKDAEDLTQEVFTTIYTSISSFKQNSKLSTWIYRIAVNKSHDYLRMINRKKRIPLFKAKPIESVFNLETHSSSPIELLEEKEFYDYVFSAINNLPQNQRIAFTLSKMEGFSYNEISDQMNLSLSAVESLIFRARKKIIEELNKYDNNK